MKQLDREEIYNGQSFEDIKRVDENGVEYWYARELMPILQYSNWQNFEKIIQKAIIACENSRISVIDHLLTSIKWFKSVQELIENRKIIN